MRSRCSACGKRRKMMLPRIMHSALFRDSIVRVRADFISADGDLSRGLICRECTKKAATAFAEAI